MFEQLTQLVQQYAGDAVVKNTAVANEHNEAVIGEATNSIFAGLQKIVAEGGVEQLTSLFTGTSSIDSSNPVVQQLTEQLTGTLGEKFGLSSADSSGVASGIIPKVLTSLVNKAKDPNDSSFTISDVISSISGNGEQASNIMDTISKYGSQFGLDQNEDGKVDVNDAIAVTKKSGGFGDLLKNIFGK